MSSRRSIPRASPHSPDLGRLGLKDLEKPIIDDDAHVAPIHRRGFRPAESVGRPDQMSPAESARSDDFGWDMEKPSIMRKLVKLDHVLG
jgi:hypothetical protein